MVTLEKGRHNLLRPEAMEAMFVLWRTTGNPVYKDWAWQMFQAFQTHCRVSSLSYNRAHLDWHPLKGQTARFHRSNAHRAALHARMPACLPARVARSFIRSVGPVQAFSCVRLRLVYQPCGMGLPITWLTMQSFGKVFLKAAQLW